MRIVEVVTHDEGRAARLSTREAPPHLGLYLAETSGECRALVGMVTELLLGAEDPRWIEAPWTAGEATLSVAEGLLRLRRSGGRHGSRLTLSAVGTRGASALAPAPAEWQQGVAAEVLASVFFASGDSSRSLGPLLSPTVAQEFRRLASRRVPTAGERSAPRDTRRVAELLGRRDELAARVEALLATRRQESAALDRRLRELDTARVALAGRADELRRQVRALADELDAAGARARYEELTRVAAEAEGRQAADQWAPRVEELDEEVAHWRGTLAELEERETRLRAELARVRPDDAAPQLILADQRASVAVAQRLLADLESEVARFARSGGSPVCVCGDAHPRLNPLVETLGRHVDRLADLVTQQEYALRTQDLLAEAAQLSRSQAELRRQLDHLLERRQTLWRSGRARIARGARDGVAYPEVTDRGALEHEHRALADELGHLEAELTSIDASRHDISVRRERLLDAAELGSWQRELDTLQAELGRVSAAPVTTAGQDFRASDVLARLTDGELTELRLAPGGRSVEARDRAGRIVRQDDFTPLEERLVGWALRMALAEAAHAAGVLFPLVLDRPFAELPDGAAANLATCLDDYARRGRQALVFTTDDAGAARLRALGVAARSLRGDSPPPRPAAPPDPPAVVNETREVVHEEEVARPLLLDVNDPIERFPVRFAGRDEAFARARVRTVGDLLGGDPSAIADELRAEGVSAELVALWQAHAALVCFTPGLDLAAAKLLTDCDLLSIEDLAEANAERLTEALRRRGAPTSVRDRVPEWIEAATDELPRWRGQGYAGAWRHSRAERRERIQDNASRRRARPARSSDAPEVDPPKAKAKRTARRRDSRSDPAAMPKPRFHLELDSDVEDAPSIGPKRAAQLAALGVRRVEQLLAADPRDLAARLGDERIDAARVVAWQHQAGLMCRVPGLRGHDAQVLVGSGFTSAEEIAAMKPAELLEFVEPFCDSSEGERVLRGSPRPDLAEVTGWVQGARQRRSVGVA